MTESAHQFIARVEADKNSAAIVLSGALDMATVPTLEDRLIGVEANGFSTTVIDLHEVTFLDCSAMHAVVAARKRADENNRHLVLAGANSLTRRIFELVGIQFLLDDQDAVGSVDA